MAKVNGVSIHAETDSALRVAAVRELLCQRAAELGLFEDGADEEKAIDRLLELEAETPTPQETECRRYYDMHLDEYRSGDMAAARHILFAVKPGTPVEALRAKAEEVLHRLKHEPENFAKLAAELSNCPSGQEGGALGQLTRGECVPEFDAALFDSEALGLQPRLVTSRYGFHILVIDHRIAGRQLPFEMVHEQIADRLAMHVRLKAFAQYVQLLAGEAEIEGVELQTSVTPLVQ